MVHSCDRHHALSGDMFSHGARVDGGADSKRGGNAVRGVSHFRGQDDLAVGRLFIAFRLDHRKHDFVLGRHLRRTSAGFESRQMAASERASSRRNRAIFVRFGPITVFLCRFIPVVRHFISIPAGVGKMPLKSFIPMTLIGALIWNLFLTFAGFKLKQNWESLRKYFHLIDYVILAIIVILVVAFIVRQVVEWRAQAAACQQATGESTGDKQ